MVCIFKFLKKKALKPDHCAECSMKEIVNTAADSAVATEELSKSFIDLSEKVNAISLIFATKKEAVGELMGLRNTDDYEIVQNRANGKITKGWVLRKRK